MLTLTRRSLVKALGIIPGAAVANKVLGDWSPSVADVPDVPTEFNDRIYLRYANVVDNWPVLPQNKSDYMSRLSVTSKWEQHEYLIPVNAIATAIVINGGIASGIIQAYDWTLGDWVAIGIGDPKSVQAEFILHVTFTNDQGKVRMRFPTC